MTVGFFGKVRSHGDFVSRRLPPEMVAPFDAWVQAGLVQSRRDLGADWLPTWLSSPLWRFVLAPGVCGPEAWTGVMMPSADRVGRCFPLVVAAGLARAPALRDCLTRHADWFVQMENLLLASLDGGFSVDDFEAKLQVPHGAPTGVDAGSLALDAATVTGLAGPFAPLLSDASLAGRSAWWTDGSPRMAPCLAVAEGLPGGAGWTALLDGQWLACGWKWL